MRRCKEAVDEPCARLVCAAGQVCYGPKEAAQLVTQALWQRSCEQSKMAHRFAAPSLKKREYFMPSATVSSPANTRLSATLTRTASVLGGAVLLSLASRLYLPFLGTAVPFTAQPQAVIFVAALLGPRLGGAAVLAWFAAAFSGLPVLATAVASPLSFVGPTAGYLWSYPLVAWFVGHYGRGKGLATLAIWVAAALFTLAMGTAWLSLFVGGRMAWASGVAPFLYSDLAKVVGCFLLQRMGRDTVNRIRRRA